MVTYVFREPLTILNAKKANPQRIGEALEKIAVQSGGRLTPKGVVSAAKDPKHVLHRHFEWNDAKAAEAYRIDQARELIRVVRVEDSEGEPKRAYLNIGDRGHAYRSLADVMGSADLQAAVLRQADLDLAAWQRRYAELTEACADVMSAREKIAERRARQENRPSA